MNIYICCTLSETHFFWCIIQPSSIKTAKLNVTSLLLDVDISPMLVLCVVNSKIARVLFHLPNHMQSTFSPESHWNVTNNTTQNQFNGYCQSFKDRCSNRDKSPFNHTINESAIDITPAGSDSCNHHAFYSCPLVVCR